jgi:hypothetical protein
LRFDGFQLRLWPAVCLALWCVVAGAVGYAAPAVEIFPSGTQLPANHLKFYLHFPERMRQGVFLEYCRLLNESGEPVLEPFRDTELWSEDGLRLTLWLHPGRQKTGVNLNTEFGPVLQPDRKYTLVISGRWPTERGPALGADTFKPFQTGPRVTQQLDAADWKITAPQAGTEQPLIVRFPAPLDHALLVRCLRVDGFPGRVETADAEREWRFLPALPWPAKVQHLQADSILEDLGGNSLARPFEVDLQAAPPRHVPAKVEVPFQPVEASN